MIGNLLTEKLIETDCGIHSLPGLFAAMARGETASFPALRPHQRPAWHMFLVQLAVIALSRTTAPKSIPEEENAWQATLRSMTLDFEDGAPWHLVVEDTAKPAFMQPPDPGGLKWSEVATPDMLDMLITSRNHDVKREIAYDAAPQDWLFALVSLQTMEGFGGFGNYGIARMNGGSSSRVMLTLAPALEGTTVVDPSAWWRRDVMRLLNRPRDVNKRNVQFSPALLWCLPWPEEKKPKLELDALDPLFIEVCRRIRLTGQRGMLKAIRATSEAARIYSKEAKGVTGDPWAPVQIKENKTLTLGERGDWNHKLLSDLLYGEEWDIPELARDLPDEKDTSMVLIAEAFARGNSKTDGFKSCIIPVPKVVKKNMFGTETIKLSKAQIETISKVDRALRDGLSLIAAKGRWDKRGKKEYTRSLPARAAFSIIADNLFFPTLWCKLAAESENGRNTVQLRFTRQLASAARAEYTRAAPGIPCSRIMRPRAEFRGRKAFEAAIRRIFKDMGVEEKDHA